MLSALTLICFVCQFEIRCLCMHFSPIFSCCVCVRESLITMLKSFLGNLPVAFKCSPPKFSQHIIQYRHWQGLWAKRVIMRIGCIHLHPHIQHTHTHPLSIFKSLNKYSHNDDLEKRKTLWSYLFLIILLFNGRKSKWLAVRVLTSNVRWHKWHCNMHSFSLIGLFGMHRETSHWKSTHHWNVRD